MLKLSEVKVEDRLNLFRRYLHKQNDGSRHIFLHYLNTVYSDEETCRNSPELDNKEVLYLLISRIMYESY